MPFTIIRNDITKLSVDAVVNAANTSLRMGGGVCGAIFNAAGPGKLQDACDKLAPIKTGEAVITPGFNLPAKYVIHAAGPVWRGGNQGEEALLRSCYTNALGLAAEHGCESVAFPLISSGIYGYPKDGALRVATAAIRDFLSLHDIDVSLVVFDKAAFSVSKELLGGVESYISEHYVEERQRARRRLLNIEEAALFDMEAAERSAMLAPPEVKQFMPPATKPPVAGVPGAPGVLAAEEAAGVPEPAGTGLAGLADLIGNLDEPFSAALLRLIDATGKKDAEIYRRANIDRRLFSKIRSKEHYAPGKATVLAFAVALELNLEQTAGLLERAGFALSRSRKFDVIVEYFIKNRKYDVFEINEVLFSYDQPLLGG